MAKKNQTEQKPENTDIESVPSDPQTELNLPDQDVQKDAAENASQGLAAAEADPENDSSADDLLDDVRRSLIEEEVADRTEQDSKWWRRIGRKSKSTAQETPPVVPEIDLPATPFSETVDREETDTQVEESTDPLEELLEALEAEVPDTTPEVPISSTVETEIPPPPPEPEIDFAQRKEQAFRPRPADEAPESPSDVRSIALEDGEEVFVEVSTQVADPMQERLGAFENAMKPYRKYIYIALALLGVAMAVTASLILFNVYQQSRPTPVREASNLPYPTAVSLPGGWSFQLGKGTIQNGRWDPRGAEWLEGTEVCRWVALPWSTQLEAVLRTLTPDDPIELFMSNNDKLVYEVYSIRQLTPQEMQQLDSNSPCLLLILTQADSDKHWVLTALP